MPSPKFPTRMDLHTLPVILILHFLFIFDDILLIFHENMKSRRRGISWHPFCRRNFLKSLDMNLVSIKKHESCFPKDEPTFHFLGEVIPITNQRTDSHPCIRFLHPMLVDYLVSRWFLGGQNSRPENPTWPHLAR